MTVIRAALLSSALGLVCPGCSRPPQGPSLIPQKLDFSADEEIIVPLVLSPEGGDLDPARHRISLRVHPNTRSEEVLASSDFDVPAPISVAQTNVPVGRASLGRLPLGNYVLNVRIEWIVQGGELPRVEARGYSLRVNPIRQQSAEGDG
jgi:hypothetical protein